MRFPWAAGIALWTFMTGPIFGPPASSQFPYQHQTRAATLVKKATPRPAPERASPKRGSRRDGR
jgi:hypothetical protein